MPGPRQAALPLAPFVKYQGLGNDFVIVSADALAPALADEPGGEPALARRLCDRRRGVGADGLLIAAQLATSAAGPRWQMVVYNADGSRPQMCGNGLRCFVRWLVETGCAPAVVDAPLVVATDAGPKRCVWRGGDEVEVEIGRAQMTRAALPMTGDAQGAQDTFASLQAPWGEPVALHGVSVGNPHAVVWEAGPRTTESAERLGRWVCEHPLFPAQVNVEFVHERADGALEVIVYERGCGLTQACGTGAAAVVASWAQRAGLVEAARTVILPGGPLRVRADADAQLWIQGEAARVFAGTWG
jgi:diaminopimelate epimerase